MKLNRELRSKDESVRLRNFWIIFYAVIIAAIIVLGARLYRSHSGDRLPSGHIELTVNKTRYQPGEIVEFTVKNNFPTTIYVSNTCPAEPLNVYQWQDKRWLQIHDTAIDEDSDCYNQPRNIPVPANKSLTYNYSDWPNLFAKPGVYRIVMLIDHYDQLPFQDFVVLDEQKTIVEPAEAKQSLPVINQGPDDEHEDEEDEHEIEIEGDD